MSGIMGFNFKISDSKFLVLEKEKYKYIFFP